MMSGSSSGMRSRRRRKSSSVTINITPFVDVMLVLLVIFMVTSPMLAAGVKVDLPETSATPVSGQDEPISVDVNSKGQVFIQSNEIKLEELEQKLKAITKEKYDSRIFVRGDKNVDYGRVMVVIGTINQSGFNKVALITAIKQEPSHKK